MFVCLKITYITHPQTQLPIARSLVFLVPRTPRGRRREEREPGNEAGAENLGVFSERLYYEENQ